jgi:hypothetical protein
MDLATPLWDSIQTRLHQISGHTYYISTAASFSRQADFTEDQAEKLE